MPTQRQARINSLLQAEISQLLQREVDDEALLWVTITGVEVSPDLHHARVYASVLGDEASCQQALTALKRQRRYLQRRLGENLRLRYTPRLNFIADRTATQAQRIEALLSKIAAEAPPPNQAEASLPAEEEPEEE